MNSTVDEHRIADQLAKQAEFYRDGGNTSSHLRLLLDRYSRLVSEIIPQYPSFSKYPSSEKLRHQEILQEVVKEIKKLMPLNGRKDCVTGERTPKSIKTREDSLHLTSPGCEESGLALLSYKMEKVNHCCTIGIHAQKTRSSFLEENTKMAAPFPAQTMTSSALFRDDFPVAPAAARERKVNMHQVKHFFPSSLSFTERLPLVGHISYTTIPEPNKKYLESSSKESTSKSVQDVHISARLMEEFMELARANTNSDLETCGILGAFLENRVFFITTLIIPKQESTSNSCQAINEEEIYAIQEERSLFTAGWIHTHPSQSCFLSSIDLHTQYSYQVMLPEAVAIVMAPTDSTRSYGIFRLTDPGGMSVLKQCQERGFHPHPETADGSPIFESCSNVYINPNLRFEIIDLRASSP